MSVDDKYEECFLKDHIKSSCMVFLFSFDMRYNQWITHTFDKASLNITPKNGALHEIGYLICKSLQKKIDSLERQKISN